MPKHKSIEKEDLRSQYKLLLNFSWSTSASGEPILCETWFKHSNLCNEMGEPLAELEAEQGEGGFTWENAARSLAYLMVRYAREKETETEFRGKALKSLYSALRSTRRLAWATRIFGYQSPPNISEPMLYWLFQRAGWENNPKVSIRRGALPPEQIYVECDEVFVPNDSEGILLIERALQLFLDLRQTKSQPDEQQQVTAKKLLSDWNGWLESRRRSPDYNDHQQGRLPKDRTLFVGRREEVAWIKELLPSFPLITLVGPPGVGKTRLAQETALAVEADYQGAIWFVSLADISNGGLIIDEIASAIGLDRSNAVRLQERVEEKLSRRPSMIVLDNFEQVVDSGALIVKQLMERVRDLACLVTSRTTLDIRGENVLPVAPLAVPSRGMAIEDLREVESVRLFVDRARSVNPSFRLTEENATDVVTICELVGGISLFIEMAALKLRVFSSVRETLESMVRLCDALVNDRRDADSRHRSAFDLIEWSYRLLAPELRQFFTRLSIFRGGFTVEAAERVCQQPQAQDLLTRLFKDFLLKRERIGKETRYRMIEVFREFGGRKMNIEQKESIAQSHADYFFDLTEKASQKLIGAEQTAWLDRLEIERDNIRAALDYYRNKQSTALQELKLAVFLCRFWEIRGYFSEGREVLQHALSRQQPGASPLKAQGLGWLGLLSERQSDYEYAKQALSESVTMSREIGNKECLAFSSNHMGWVVKARGQYSEAKSFFMESLKLSQEMNSHWLIGEAFCGLGFIAEIERDYASAKDLYQEYLSKSREIKNLSGEAGALHRLGVVAREEEDYPAARRYHEQSLALKMGLGDKWGAANSCLRLGFLEEVVGKHQAACNYYQKALALYREVWNREAIAGTMERIGRMAEATGDGGAAARIFGASDAVRNSISAPLSPNEQKNYGQTISSIKERFPAEWQEGTLWAIDEAITYALSFNITSAA